MYDEEIARSLAEISEQIRDNKTRTPTFFSPTPKTSTIIHPEGIHDSTVIKFGMIVGIMVLAYLIIQATSKRK